MDKFRIFDKKLQIIRPVFTVHLSGWPEPEVSMVTCCKVDRSDYEDVYEFDLLPFTGWKDSNGVSIYAGDIVRKHLDGVKVKPQGSDEWLSYEDNEIKMEGGRWTLVDSTDYEGTPWINPDYDRFEVIGNVYGKPLVQ